jgi:hypothetical protein
MFTAAWYSQYIYGIGANINILSKSISELIGNSFILLSGDPLWNSASSKLWTDWNRLRLKNDSYAPSSLVINGLAIQISQLQKLLTKVCKISLFSRHGLFLIKFWSPKITVMGSYWLPVGYVYRWTNYYHRWIPSVVHPFNRSFLRTVLIHFSE